jgi:hypothetical protein
MILLNGNTLLAAAISTPLLLQTATCTPYQAERFWGSLAQSGGGAPVAPVNAPVAPVNAPPRGDTSNVPIRETGGHGPNYVKYQGRVEMTGTAITPRVHFLEDGSGNSHFLKPGCQTTQLSSMEYVLVTIEANLSAGELDVLDWSVADINGDVPVFGWVISIGNRVGLRPVWQPPTARAKSFDMLLVNSALVTNRLAQRIGEKVWIVAASTPNGEYKTWRAGYLGRPPCEQLPPPYAPPPPAGSPGGVVAPPPPSTCTAGQPCEFLPKECQSSNFPQFTAIGRCANGTCGPLQGAQNYCSGAQCTVQVCNFHSDCAPNQFCNAEPGNHRCENFKGPTCATPLCWQRAEQGSVVNGCSPQNPSVVCGDRSVFTGLEECDPPGQRGQCSSSKTCNTECKCM